MDDRPFDGYLGLALFAIVVLAGITSVSGGLLAGVLIAGGTWSCFISAGVAVASWQLVRVIAGIGVIVTVIFNPEGLVGPTHRQLEQLARKMRWHGHEENGADAAADRR